LLPGQTHQQQQSAQPAAQKRTLAELLKIDEEQRAAALNDRRFNPAD